MAIPTAERAQVLLDIVDKNVKDANGQDGNLVIKSQKPSKYANSLYLAISPLVFYSKEIFTYKDVHHNIFIIQKS